MLSIISIDAALEQFLTDAEARYQDMRAKDASTRRWQCPAACIDFIVLLLGWFYEQERELYVWHLDEFVLRELGLGMAALEEALRLELVDRRV